MADRTRRSKRREEVGSLIELVVEAVGELGLVVTDPRVLGVGANLVIHLAPAPVVARVATLTAEMRGSPDAYLAVERDVSAGLAERGCPVVAPTGLVDPGPHLAGGRWFVLMEHRDLTPLDPACDEHAVRVGRSYADLADAMAGLRPPSLDRVAPGHPWHEIDVLLTIVAPSTDPDVRERITTAIGDLRAGEPDEGWRLVHGDAHRVNVALSDGRVIWYDFEDANLRPLAWDLATLRRAWPRAGDVACELLGVDPASPTMRWHHELREVYALLWNLLYAQRDPTTRPATAARLDRWLTTR